MVEKYVVEDVRLLVGYMQELIKHVKRISEVMSKLDYSEITNSSGSEIITNKEKSLMKNIFQCDECKSENLELIKRETKQKWDNYYMEIEYFDVLTFKCKDCGCETVECP